MPVEDESDMWTLKHSDFDTQGTQKTPNVRSCFDANLIDFENDWDKQCTEINALFPQQLMLFQQFCFSVVGEYEQGQAHLCVRAATFYALPVLSLIHI